MPLTRHDGNFFAFLCEPVGADDSVRPSVSRGGSMCPCVGGGVLDAPSVHRKILRSSCGPSGTPALTRFYRWCLRSSRGGFLCSCVGGGVLDAPSVYREILRSSCGPSGTPAPTAFYRWCLRIVRRGTWAPPYVGTCVHRTGGVEPRPYETVVIVGGMWSCRPTNRLPIPHRRAG